MEIVKNTQVEMLEIKTLINQIQTIVGSIISKQDVTEKIILQIKDKIEGLLHTNNQKRKKINTTYKSSVKQSKVQT
jgi:hypothetical protein